MSCDDPADDRRGPACYPRPPRTGLLGAVVTTVRLPADLLVLIGYTVRQAPHLVQDVRSVVNDVARLVHHGEREGAAVERRRLVTGPTGSVTS